MVGIFVEVLVRRSWKRVLCFISLHWESRANKAIPRVAIITCLRTASSGKVSGNFPFWEVGIVICCV